MAKGQHLSAYQQGIVRRYYQHLDTLTLGKLAELVSDLAVAAPGGKEAAKLWKRAREALEKAGVEAGKVEAIVGRADVKALAEEVGRLAGGGGGGRGGGRTGDSRSM